MHSPDPDDRELLYPDDDDGDGGDGGNGGARVLLMLVAMAVTLLMAILDRDTPMNEAKFYGGARYLSITGAVTIDSRLARVWSISAAAGPITVIAANPTPTQLGGFGLVVFNVGVNTFNLFLQDVASVPIPAGQVLILAASILPPLTVPRWYGALRPTGTGTASVVFRTVVVAGGAGLTTSAAIYTETTNTWGASGAIPNQKQDAAGINQNGGKGYVVGRTPILAAVSNKTDEYGAGAWINRRDLPFLTAQACAVSFPSFAFGKLFSGSGTPNTAEYRLDAWTAKKVVPYTKTRGSAQVVGTKAFIISGDPVPMTNLGHEPIADIYWTIAFQPGARRHSMGTFAIEHRIYAVGGREDVVPTRYDLNDEYTPATDSWVARALAGTRWSGCGIGANARGYLMGGRDGADAASSAAQSYSLDAWTTRAGMPAARADVQNAGVVFERRHAARL